MADRWFFNERATWAKKRQPASSPTRIIRNHIHWVDQTHGVECKWCGVWNEDLVKLEGTEKWTCLDCLGALALAEPNFKRRKK